MEEETNGRPARKADVLVGGWRVCGHQGNHSRSHRGEPCGFTRSVWRKTARERWDRSNLEMMVAVPWRKNEDDAKMDGEGLKGEVG